MDREHHFRGKTRTRFDLSHQSFSRNGDPHLSADRVTIAGHPSFQFHHQAIAALLHLVKIESRWRVVIVDDEIELAITIKISDGDTTTIPNTIRASRPRDIHELTVPDVGEKAFAFVTIPGVLAHEVIAEETPLLVLLHVCDRTAGEG